MKGVLVNKGVKPIYTRLQPQHDDETLRQRKTFEWCNRFKDGHTSVNYDPG